MSKKITELVVSSLEDIKAKIVSIDKKLDLVLGSCVPSTAKPCDVFNNLPWKYFKEDQGDAWIYANQKGAEQLVERLKNAMGNTIYCKGYRYSLSKDGKFVRRHPVRNRRGGENGE